MKPNQLEAKLSKMIATYGSLPEGWPAEEQGWYAAALQHHPALAHCLKQEQALDASFAASRILDARLTEPPEDQDFALRIIQVAAQLPQTSHASRRAYSWSRLLEWAGAVFLPAEVAWKPAFALAMTLLCSGFLLGQQAPLSGPDDAAPDILYQEEIW